MITLHWWYDDSGDDGDGGATLLSQISLDDEKNPQISNIIYLSALEFIWLHINDDFYALIQWKFYSQSMLARTNIKSNEMKKIKNWRKREVSEDEFFLKLLQKIIPSVSYVWYYTGEGVKQSRLYTTLSLYTRSKSSLYFWKS